MRLKKWVETNAIFDTYAYNGVSGYEVDTYEKNINKN
jgi:hypothetical protein